jgi:hypothetical protein
MTKETPISEPLLANSRTFGSNNAGYYPQSDNPYHSLDSNTITQAPLSSESIIEYPCDIDINTWSILPRHTDPRLLVCPFSLMMTTLYVIILATFSTNDNTSYYSSGFVLLFWILQIISSCKVCTNYPNRSYLVPVYEDSAGILRVVVGDKNVNNDVEGNNIYSNNNNNNNNNSNNNNNIIDSALIPEPSMKLQSRNTQTHASAFVLNLLAFGASIAGGILCDFNSSFRNYCFGLAVVAFFGAVFSIMACRLEKKSNSIARAFWGDKLED